jgi:hypothetical protein
MFKDFGAWTNSDGAMPPDPVLSYIRQGAQVTSGNVGGAWTRPYLSFVPDRDSKYLAIGARVMAPNQIAGAGLEHEQAQYFTKWQLERAQTSGIPRDYESARQVQVVVKPDRINLVVNPRLETAVTSWVGAGNCTVSRSTTLGYGALLMVSTAAGGMRASQDVAYRMPVRPKAVYTGQATFIPDVLAPSRSVQVRFAWYDSNLQVISYTTGAYVTESAGEEVIATVTGTAPDNAVTAAFQPYVNGAGAAESHRVTYFVVEEGEVAGPYFDGASGDDYMWETGGAAHLSRSYFYENRLDRGEALLRTLWDTVPVGIGVGTPQFAVFTG